MLLIHCKVKGFKSKMIKLALTSYYKDNQYYNTKYSLASLRLASYILHVKDVETKILPIDLGEDSQEIANNIISLNLDIVGFSLYMWTYKKSREIANLIYDMNKDLVIVVGGPEACTLDESEWPDTTFFILGEGEKSLRWIVEQKVKNPSFSTFNADIPVKSIFTKATGRINSCLVFEDVLPVGLPIYSKEFLTSVMDMNNFENEFTWYDTLVGCPYKCGYCGHRTRPSQTLRADELIESEIKNIGKLNFKEVFIIDPILGGKKERDKKILNWFKLYAPNTKINVYYRPEYLDYETIALLGDSNIKEVLIGLQSTNPDVPFWLRSNDLGKVKKYLPELSKRNIFNRIELIIGMPGDSYKGLRESLRFVIDEIQPLSIWAYHLTVIPGTELYTILNSLDNKHWVKINKDSQAIEANSYTEEELHRMLVYAGAVTSLYNYAKQTENHITMEFIEHIVFKEINNGSTELLQIFQSGDMVRGKEHWKCIL